jgi:hypothetical protein
MVFVHSRKDTGKTARLLAEMAAGEDAALFDTRENSKVTRVYCENAETGIARCFVHYAVVLPARLVSIFFLNRMNPKANYEPPYYALKINTKFNMNRRVLLGKSTPY